MPANKIGRGSIWAFPPTVPINLLAMPNSPSTPSGRYMADYSDYYSTIARAISGLPGKTEEARGAIYELARTALQKGLGALDPPISETDLAIERLALEAAIQRVETESRFSDTRHRLKLHIDGKAVRPLSAGQAQY